MPPGLARSGLRASRMTPMQHTLPGPQMPKRDSETGEDATLGAMDYQGGGYQTGARHALGTGPQQAAGRDPARGYPPARTSPTQPQPQVQPPEYPADDPDQQAGGNAHSPVSGYRPEDWTTPSVPTPPDGPGGPGRRDARQASRGPRPRRKLLIGAAAVVAVAVLGGAGYEYFGKSDTHGINPGSSLRLPTSNPTAESSYFSNKLGRWQHITTRKLDPEAVTVAELYPPGFVLFGTKDAYQRVAASSDSTCSLAIFGAELQASVQSGGCKQVVRATYVSGDSTMMGTIGVINLSTATAAQQAGEVAGSDELIAPLTASKGPAKNLLKGTGVVYAEVKGHYLVVMYAEFSNLKSPSSAAAKQQLVSFAEGMFEGSANIALSHRMLTGKPQ